MSNYTNSQLPYPHHLDKEKKVVTIFLPGGKGAVQMVQKASKAYPAHIIQFTENYRYLDTLHGAGKGFN